MDYVLTTNALSKKYGAFKALDAVSMHVPKGLSMVSLEKMALAKQRSFALSAVYKSRHLAITRYMEGKIQTGTL